MPVARMFSLLVVLLLLVAGAARAATAQVVGSRWTAPTYGFSVSWAETDWQVDPAGTLEAVGPEQLDRLHLINGVSSLYFEGATRYEGNLSSCVAEEANILSQENGVADVRPYRDESGVQVVADGPNASAAAFTLTLDVGGEEIELVDYVECRTLNADEAVLIITLVTDPGTFERELAAASAVIETITLADDIPLNPLAAYGGWLAKAQEQPSIAGPLSGEIAFGPGLVGVERVGVNAPDFYARATFTNPRPTSLASWDFGLGFRDSGEDEQFRLVVDSEGNWFLKNGLSPVIAEGTLVDVDTGDSGTNIIEIVAVGETGYFAFNERLVTELDLSAPVSGGDLFVGAGFFAEDAVGDGSSAYSDFEIWALSEVSAQEPAEPANSLDAAAFAELAATAIETAPLAGPGSGELQQTSGAAAVSAAGIAAESFVASATFINPANAAEQPWDFGIAFREQDNGDHYRITVSSDGSWEYQIGVQPDLSGGLVPGLNFAADARNSIEVVVDGNSAAFSVNGAFVAQLDASQLSEPGDVWIGAGFHRANATNESITRFADFTVWPLPIAPDVADAPKAPELPSTPGPADGAEATPPAQATPVASEGAIAREVALRLHEEHDSGIDALAVLTEEAEGVSVGIAARGAVGGEIVAIFTGRCAEPESLAAFVLDPLEADGKSETTIDARLTELNDGNHAIAISDGAAATDSLLACGEIPVQEPAA